MASHINRLVRKPSVAYTGTTTRDEAILAMLTAQAGEAARFERAGFENLNRAISGVSA
jgi:hypothetical protein